MQLELISPRVTDLRIFQKGDVIDVPDAEGRRMIDRGHARLPKPEGEPKAKQSSGAIGGKDK